MTSADGKDSIVKKTKVLQVCHEGGIPKVGFDFVPAFGVMAERMLRDMVSKLIVLFPEQRISAEHLKMLLEASPMTITFTGAEAEAMVSSSGKHLDIDKEALIKIRDDTMNDDQPISLGEGEEIQDEPATE
jgi:hypothetical protein